MQIIHGWVAVGACDGRTILYGPPLQTSTMVESCPPPPVNIETNWLELYTLKDRASLALQRLIPSVTQQAVWLIDIEIIRDEQEARFLRNQNGLIVIAYPPDYEGRCILCGPNTDTHQYATNCVPLAHSHFKAHYVDLKSAFAAAFEMSRQGQMPTAVASFSIIDVVPL